MFEKLKNFFFERDVNGDYWYTIRESSNYGNHPTDNLQLSQLHPILTPGILFIANLFAQARFQVVNADGTPKEDHWMLKKLKDPNFYQTQVDLLESVQFMKISRGYCAIYLRRGLSSDEPDGLFVLDPELIHYPKDFKTPFSFRRRDEALGNQTVTYDPDGRNLKIKLRDIVFLYDLPNGFTQLKRLSKRGSDNKVTNQFVSYSRVDGLKQTLHNTMDTLVAKNIVTKTNGKEMITAKSGGFPLQGKEAKDAEAYFNQNYGLGWNRNRTLLVKASLDWKSLHTAVRDLGLDESIKVDGNLIFTALMIPKDIMSIEAKKTTYNNFKESMTSFIQNEMQAMINDFCATFNKYLIEDGLELVGSYDHLPVMGFVEKEKYEAVKMRGEALNMLRLAGIPDEMALELLGFDRSTQLAPMIQPMQPNDNSGGGNEDKTVLNGSGKKPAYLELLEYE